MQTTVTLPLRWYTFTQNNSGGFFDRDEDLAEVVCIQATSDDEATRKAEKLMFHSNLNSCECCGDRWNWGYFDAAPNDTPMLYGQPLLEYDSSYPAGYEYRLHHFDGRIEKGIVGHAQEPSE